MKKGFFKKFFYVRKNRETEQIVEHAEQSLEKKGVEWQKVPSEKKVLFFIGHYDYLLPTLLCRSRLVDTECESDFIVLLTKNSKRTCRFIRRKCAEEQILGRFASVRDERFLGKKSEEVTTRLIKRTYDKILDSFGCSLESYDRIYMSFDEWNSFGIYLALAGVTTPVTILVKQPEQLEQDIYGYLDGRGRNIFSGLQRRYHVLSANTGFAQEILALHNPAGRREVDGIPVWEFDYETALERLDGMQKARLLEFFAVKCLKKTPETVNAETIVPQTAAAQDEILDEKETYLQDTLTKETEENTFVEEKPEEYEYLPLEVYLNREYERIHVRALEKIYKRTLKEQEREKADDIKKDAADSVESNGFEIKNAESENDEMASCRNENRDAENTEGINRKREHLIEQAVAGDAKTERILLLGDAFWFARQCFSAEYDYIRDYQLLLNAFADGTVPVVLKEHPRKEFSGKQVRRAFSYSITIPGYVPAELLGLCESIRWKKTISVGIPIPRTVETVSGETHLVRNSYFGFARLWTRLDASLQMAKHLGFSRVLCRGISEDDLYNYKTYFNQSGLELVADSALQMDNAPKGSAVAESSAADGLKCSADDNAAIKDAFIICAGLRRKDYKRFVFSLMGDNVVTILDPEKIFSFMDLKTYNSCKKHLFSWRMKKERLFMNDFYSCYEEVLMAFCGQDRMKELLQSFEYCRKLPYSGYEVHTAESASAKQLLRKLPDKPESKAYISRKAKTRPVIIYGASEIAYHFLREYGSQLNVRYVMKNKGAKADRRLWRNYKVVNFNPRRIRKGDYIIVAKSFIHNIDRLPDYAVTRDRLLRKGYRVCKQFVYYRLFDAAEKHKKIILFCGYCEMSGIKQVLELTSANRDYCMLFYHIGRETMQSAPGYRDFIASAKICDILVHAPLTVRKGVLDADVTKLISAHTQTIFISQISFRGYAPYKDIKFTRRNYALRMFGTIYYPFLYEVPILNQLIRDGHTNEEIYDVVSSLDLYSKEQVERNAVLALRILQIMDSKSDISIYEYVRGNYKKQMLFKDCIHVNDALFFEYARRLSWYLNKPYVAEIDRAQRICEENGVHFQVATEEPIFPSVAKHLGLAFAENRKYMLKVSEERVRWVDFKEWVYEYCDYYRAVRHVLRVLNPSYHTEQVPILRNELHKYSIRPYLPEPTLPGEELDDNIQAAILAQWADYNEDLDEDETEQTA